MKEQINKYARGVFEYEPLEIVANESSIFNVVDKNREFRGELHLREKKERIIKGVVYSSNDQVIIEDNAFNDRNPKIKYYVNSLDCVSGDIIEGCFDIVSNGGEISIPFSFRVEAGSHDTSGGAVRNIFQFTELAQNATYEAITLFEADDFADVFLANNLSLRAVYESLLKGTDVRNDIDEFLVAMHKKNKTEISIRENSKTYTDVKENFKDSLILEKNIWGYVDIKINTDSPFIRLERKNIDSDAFTGNRYEFSYVIDAEKLHAGNNYGRITFETIGKSITYFINVINKNEDTDNGKKRRLIYNLISLYIRFRTKGIHVNEWIRESGIVIEALRAIDENNVFYKLAQAQLYISEKKDALAKDIIENVKDEVTADSKEDYPLYCYFIYVNTLYNKDWTYSKRAAVMIKECYDKYEDWRILWTLLFIDEELEGNPSLKLLKIKEQYNGGCKSPIMYLEACRTFNQNPALLRVLNSFEISVLLFGAKNKFLEDKLIDHALELIDTTRNRTGSIVKLMLLIWENDNDKPILESLCRTLIRNNYVGEKYLKIYEAGINSEIKITQLFEYYMMSRNPKDMSPLPKLVRMYFSYNNNLDYLKKAYLFANIIVNKADNPQTYRTYLPQMELFVKEQCKTGHINDNLWIIYKNIFNAEMVTEENAEAVSKLFFTYKITTNNINYNKVYVRHKEVKTEQEYAINKLTAYVQIYTEDPAITFVSQRGNRFTGGADTTITRLLEDEAVIKKCLEVNNKLFYVILSECEKRLKYQKQTMDSVDAIKSIAGAEELNDEYRKQLISAVVGYYYDTYDFENFAAFLSQVKMNQLSKKDLDKVIEILITQGEYENAYKLLEQHSADNIIPKRLMKLCSKRIVTTDEGHARLINLCFMAFKKDSYDELILQYLNEFYNGSTNSMVDIWKSMVKFEVDAYEIEERIIAQSLFARQDIPELADIFSHYYSMAPRERIAQAYLAYYSYTYFILEKEVPDTIFELLEASFENEKELSDVCKMAILKYYSKKTSLSEFRRELASRFIYELTRKGVVFPYFLNLRSQIKLPFDIADRSIVSYRTNPESHVVIHYVYEDDDHKKNYISEEMHHIYGGIFVKQFILFYGESLQYYITDEYGDVKNTTEGKVLTNRDTHAEQSEGRFEQLNDLIICNEQHDGETFRKLMRTYAVNENVTNEMLKML